MKTRTVQTEFGRVLGEERKDTIVFHGIPYGDACDGKNRFCRAKEPACWSGVRDCTKNGPIAMQRGGSIVVSWDFGDYFSGGHPERFGCEDETAQENCLVLNVMTPGLTSGKRPVVVYLHGGGYAEGSSSIVLGADRFVTEQDVVLVGVNHRLNAFGFLYLGEIDEAYAESGTNGMTDILLALQWIRRNIEQFGGDPGNVLLMGESGGGAKITTLLAMPQAVPYFQHAIVESAFGKPGRYTREAAAERTERFLFALGIRENAIARLQALPKEHVLAAAAYLGPFAFEPVADEKNLPYNEADGFVRSVPAIDLMVGSSEDEIAAFASYEEHQLPTRAQMVAALTKGFGPGWMHLHGITEEKANHVIEAFYREQKKPIDDAHLLMKICTMCGPLEQFSFDHAVYCSREREDNVYRYLSTFDAPHRVIPGKKFAWHGADLPLQFRIVRHPECERMSQILSAFVGQFARSGNPSTDEFTWNVFAEEKNTMILDDVPHMEADPTAYVREALQEERKNGHAPLTRRSTIHESQLLRAYALPQLTPIFAIRAIALLAHTGLVAKCLCVLHSRLATIS